MNKPTVRLKGLTRALSYGVLSPFLLTAALHAQTTAEPVDAAKEAAAEEDGLVILDKFEVTGTRLTSAAAEGGLSVSSYKLDTDLGLKGYSNFGDMLRVKLPQYGGGIGVINDSFGNGGSGQSTISLRNLPGSRTLVLVNGRRTSADLNLIPNAAIDSIEVLNDGAAAVYGSEAIAGVVNIKLKNGFEGLYTSARYANTTTTDISERRFSMAAGIAVKDLRVSVSYEWSKANEQMGTDREISSPSGDMVSGTSNPGLFTPRFTSAELTALQANPADAANQLYVLVPLRWYVNADTTDGLKPGVSLPASFNPSAYILADKSTTTAQRNALRAAEEARLNGLLGNSSPVLYGPNYTYSSLGDLNPGFPYGFYTPSYRGHERNGATASIEKDIFGKSLTAFAEVLYSTNVSANMLAPSPLGGNVLPATNYFVSAVFPGISSSRSFTYGYRPTELGPRIYDDEFTSRRLVTGLRGELDHNWKWEAAYMYDEWDYHQTQSGGVMRDLFTSALTSTSAAGAFNPFGATPLFGTSSPVNSDELIQSFFGSADGRYKYDIRAVDASISGAVAKLPAGDLSVAVGAEYRSELERDEPSEALINGDVFPFNAEPAFRADRSIRSVYAEVGVPILKSLTLSAAGRLEDYSDVGSTGLKPRINLRWEVLPDQVTIRGSWAQGFVAPSLLSLKAGDRGQSFDEVLNPVTGTRTQPEDGVYYVGNPSLKPSESDSYLVGAVFSPKAVQNLTLGINYYRIEETGIPFESAQYIVTQWADAGGEDNASNPFGPTAAPSAANPTGAQVEVAPSGELAVVRNVGPINSGERMTDGIDLFASYKFETAIGEFSPSLSWTRVLSFEQEDFPGAGTIDYLGQYWGSGAALGNYGFPKWKGSVGLDWSFKSFGASLSYNYTDGYLENENDMNKVPAYETFDLRLSYRLPWWETTIAVGVNNLFDEDPPLVLTSFESNIDRAVSDIRGRMVFAELSSKF